MTVYQSCLVAVLVIVSAGGMFVDACQEAIDQCNRTYTNDISPSSKEAKCEAIETVFKCLSNAGGCSPELVKRKTTLQGQVLVTLFKTCACKGVQFGCKAKFLLETLGEENDTVLCSPMQSYKTCLLLPVFNCEEKLKKEIKETREDLETRIQEAGCETGLSKGAIIGIACGVAVVALILIAVGVFFGWRWYQQRN